VLISEEGVAKPSPGFVGSLPGPRRKDNNFATIVLGIWPTSSQK